MTTTCCQSRRCSITCFAHGSAHSFTWNKFGQKTIFSGVASSPQEVTDVDSDILHSKMVHWSDALACELTTKTEAPTRIESIQSHDRVLKALTTNLDDQLELFNLDGSLLQALAQRTAL